MNNPKDKFHTLPPKNASDFHRRIWVRSFINSGVIKQTNSMEETRKRQNTKSPQTDQETSILTTRTA
jgi:hypothetical protein